LRASLLPLAVTWYLLTTFPTSNLLVTTGTIFGERLLYLPGVALCLVVGMGVGWAIRKYRTGVIALTGLILVAFSLQTLRYSAAWSDDLSLFQWATASVPNSTKAHHKLGEEYLRVGDLGNALRSLRQALEIAPDNEFAALTMVAARQAVTNEYLPAGDSPQTHAPSPSDPDVLYLIGQLSRDQGDTATATRYLRDAVRNKPGMAGAWLALAEIFLAQGARVEAAAALRDFIDAAGSRYTEQVNWARGVLIELEGI
jgi:tetratricopeptide (TPR) repeat protein